MRQSFIEALALLDDGVASDLAVLWDAVKWLPDDFRDIPLMTQDHHGIGGPVKIGELPKGGCSIDARDFSANNFLLLAQRFVIQLPLMQADHHARRGVDLISSFLAETEMVAYCDCCGQRIHYQLDLVRQRFDIAAHQQHQFAESGKDASCQYHHTGPLSVTIETPSQAIVVTKDIRPVIDENLPRLITQHINKKMLRMAGSIPSKAEYREITNFLQSLKIGYFNTNARKHFIGITDDQLIITTNRFKDTEIIGEIESDTGICILDHDHFTRLAVRQYSSVAKGLSDSQGVVIETGVNTITLQDVGGKNGQAIEVTGTINHRLIDKRVRAEHR